MSQVSEWYSGQHILVTGATGFMGKILVEKLLRSCSGVSTIYLLVRSKRGRNPQDRLEDFINSSVFDNIRDSPGGEHSFKKLQCICGDLLQKGLNLSNNDKQVLQDNVTTVFHMAANVRFDQSIKSAMLMNTGGTLRILELAVNFRNLKTFVHVSTSYCFCEQTELEERTYKAPHNPRKMLDLATWMDDDLLNLLTPRLIKDAPNTYAYTKCLTEQLVTDYAAKIPIAIARPSIVTAVWKEPIAGWVENLNGPTGIFVGAGKGVIRSMMCNAKLEADFMPVDIAINNLILIAWKLGTSPRSNEPLVVNVTNKDNPITWGDALEIGRKHFYENPFSVCLWYPGGSIKSNYIIHALAVFFLHIVPAYFVDFLITIVRGKPFLIRTQRRIQIGLKVLQYYTTRPWHFHNDKIKKISVELSETDRKKFYVDLTNLNWDKYILDYILGARKYCVHEEPETIPYARKVLRRLYLLDLAKNVVIGLLFLWFVFSYATVIFDSTEAAVEGVSSRIFHIADT